MENQKNVAENSQNPRLEAISKLEGEIARLSVKLEDAEEEVAAYTNLFDEENTGPKRTEALVNLKNLKRESKRKATQFKKEVSKLKSQLKKEQAAPADPVPEPEKEGPEKDEDLINRDTGPTVRAGKKRATSAARGVGQPKLSPWNEVLQNNENIEELEAFLNKVREDRSALVTRSTALIQSKEPADIEERKNIEAQLQYINDNDIIFRFENKIKELKGNTDQKKDTKEPKAVDPAPVKKEEVGAEAVGEAVREMAYGLDNFANKKSFPAGFEALFIERLTALTTAFEDTNKLQKGELRHYVQNTTLPEVLAALVALDSYEKDEPSAARITPPGIKTIRDLLTRTKKALANIHGIQERSAASDAKKEGTRPVDAKGETKKADTSKPEAPKTKAPDFETAIKEDPKLRTAGGILHTINKFIELHLGEATSITKDNLPPIDAKRTSAAIAEIDLLLASLPTELTTDTARTYVKKVFDRCSTFIKYFTEDINNIKNTELQRLYFVVFELLTKCEELGVGKIEGLKKPKPAPEPKKPGTEAVTTEEELNKAIADSDPRLLRGNTVRKLNSTIGLRKVTALTAAQVEPVVKELEFLASALNGSITVGSEVEAYVKKNILQPCVDLHKNMWELSDTPPAHLAKLRAANDEILATCIASGYISADTLKKPEPATTTTAEATSTPTPEPVRVETLATLDCFLETGGPDIQKEKEYKKFKTWLDANIELGTHQESVRSARVFRKTEAEWFTIYKDQAETVDKLQKLNKEGLLDTFGSTLTREQTIRRDRSVKHLMYELFTDPTQLDRVKTLVETIEKVKENNEKIAASEAEYIKLNDQLEAVSKAAVTSEQLAEVYSHEHLPSADTALVANTMKGYLTDISNNYTKDLGSSTESTGNIGARLFSKYNQRVLGAHRGGVKKFFSWIGSAFASEAVDTTNPVTNRAYTRFTALLKILRDNQIVERRTSPVVSVDTAKTNMGALVAYIDNPTDPAVPENIKRAYNQMFKLIASSANLTITDAEKEVKARDIQETPIMVKMSKTRREIRMTERDNSAQLAHVTFPSDTYEKEIGFYILESDMDDIIKISKTTLDLAGMHTLKDRYEPVAHTMKTESYIPENTKIKFNTTMKAVAKSIEGFINGKDLAADDLDVISFVIDAYTDFTIKKEKKLELITSLKKSLEKLKAGLNAAGRLTYRVSQTEGYITQLETMEATI